MSLDLPILQLGGCCMHLYKGKISFLSLAEKASSYTQPDFHASSKL